MGKQNQFYDFTKCPDCGKKQTKEKQVLDDCENTDCESFIGKFRGKLVWNNPNWR